MWRFSIRHEGTPVIYVVTVGDLSLWDVVSRNLYIGETHMRDALGILIIITCFVMMWAINTSATIERSSVGSDQDLITMVEVFAYIFFLGVAVVVIFKKYRKP